MSRIIWYNQFILKGGFRYANYPILSNATYSWYVQHYRTGDFVYENDENHTRSVTLPPYLKNAIPYYDSYHQAYDYYKNICLNYRQAEKNRFPKVEKGLYGFVDADGKDVIPARYQFAYPFDEEVGLALVQHSDGKWGYIDMQGIPRTPQNYDMASDVFVDGKTNVIRDRCLILIDTEGNELKSVYGYNKLYHKESNAEMPAISTKNELIMIDFNGNKLDKSAGPFTFADFVKDCTLRNYPHIRGREGIDSDIVKQEKVVDLGLSIKWAGWNVGATAPEGDGIKCGWAAPTGKDKTGKKRREDEFFNRETKEWISSSYGGKNPPECISGTSFDIATAIWGKDWRLPTKEEFLELIEKCQWQEAYYKGSKGYVVTGPNQNRIFIKDAFYWSGNLDLSNQNKAFVLGVWRNGIGDPLIRVNSEEREGEYGNIGSTQVRPVYIK